MGLAALAVLLCSNVFISLLRKVIPESMRIPCYIVIIAGFVTIVKLLVQAYLPDLYETLGVYLDLITVNCIILGRAEIFAKKNPVLKSALDGIGMGIGFTLAITVMATIREVFGAAAFAGTAIPFLEDYKITDPDATVREDALFLSTGDAGFGGNVQTFLEQRFQEPCRYEVGEGNG